MSTKQVNITSGTIQHT